MYELLDESEKVRKYCRSAVDLSNQLTHDRNATKRAASLCVLAVSSIAALIQLVENGENI